MGTKLGIAGLIGLGCVVAAAGGGYLALRSNAADLRPAPVTEAAQPVSAPAETLTPAPIATSSLEPAAPPTVPFKTQPVSTPQVRAVAPAPVAPDQAPAIVMPPTETPAAGGAASAGTSASAATMTPSAPVTPPAPATPAAPPAPRYDEVTLATDSVLGLLLDSTVSTKTARVEDRVTARLSRDVLVDGRLAIAAGARLEGTVTLVERGGKYKDRSRLGIAFSTLVLPDSTRVAIQTDTIFRDGDSPSGQAATKVGGSAVVGAILGAMVGGKKGAALGTAAGAAGGAAAVAAGDRADAVLLSGTPVTARLSASVTVLIEREK